jgi:hypothetical protein
MVITMQKRSQEKSFHSHPTENQEKCRLDRLNLPHGRYEKKSTPFRSVLLRFSPSCSVLASSETKEEIAAKDHRDHKEKNISY